MMRVKGEMKNCEGKEQSGTGSDSSDPLAITLDLPHVLVTL